MGLSYNSRENHLLLGNTCNKSLKSYLLYVAKIDVPSLVSSIHGCGIMASHEKGSTSYQTWYLRESDIFSRKNKDLTKWEHFVFDQIKNII